MNKHALIEKLNIFEIIEVYDRKVKEIPMKFSEIAGMIDDFESLCSTMGAFGGTAFRYDFRGNDVKDILNVLKKSSWRFVFNALNIEHIAPKTHLKHFERLLKDPPEFTLDAIRSVFKDYVSDPRGMTMKAFAEIFCTLDPFYKSHSNIKIGVKGLPKRVVVSGCGEYSTYGIDRMADIINCLMRYRGEYDLCIKRCQVKEILAAEDSYHGLHFKKFKNGNAHIFFDKTALEDINRALAEYYGEVLPDAYEHTDKKEMTREVSRDLQFYRTPTATVAWIMDHVVFHDGERILEPSCGDGAILDGIKRKLENKEGYNQHPIRAEVIGIEFHQGRAEKARNKGHTVYQDNFLTWDARGRFDHIIMNPPFYGKHYAKHIEQAYRLLATGGRITAILPCTARLNHGIIGRSYENVGWLDLPLGSFAESGTNINTCLALIYNRGK